MTTYRIKLTDFNKHFDVIVNDTETLEERLKAMYPNHEMKDFKILYSERQLEIKTMNKTMTKLYQEATEWNCRLIQLNQPRLMKAAAELTGMGLIRSVVIENAYGHLSMLLTRPDSDYLLGCKKWDGIK